MITVSIKHNLDEIARDMRRYVRQMEKALPSALNKTAAGAKTRMTRAITDTYRIKASLVRQRLTIRRARRGGFYEFSAELLANKPGKQQRSMNLIHFAMNRLTRAEARTWRRGGAGRMTQPQLPFQIKKSGGRVYVKGAFVGNKGRTVFQRTGDKRLPIVPVQTINVSQMFNTKANVGKVKQWIDENFGRILTGELKYYAGESRK